ncbi:MAG: hypothetical protein C4530_17760 [Desulfobacteraceae bacterium]|nr:MAG: hypothetical protein C4530_17760 [Desulfobacteraceae bacterium]
MFRFQVSAGDYFYAGRHSGESRNTGNAPCGWIPAFAGMTKSLEHLKPETVGIHAHSYNSDALKL